MFGVLSQRFIRPSETSHDPDEAFCYAVAGFLIIPLAVLVVFPVLFGDFLPPARLARMASVEWEGGCSMLRV
jgi:hypothetical protein